MDYESINFCRFSRYALVNGGNAHYARFFLDTDMVKLLYTLLLDRAARSQKNNWVDGFVYTTRARIYDRLLEMCVPISCIGVGFRKETAQEKLKRLKTLMG